MKVIATISVLFALATAGAAWPVDATTAHSRKWLQNEGAGPEPKQARAQTTFDSCTMAVPQTHATVETEIANAADFCELVSQALAVDVFRAPMLVTPGLWHYSDAAVSCRLRYGDSAYRMTIRNSPAACQWLLRLAPSWHLESATTGSPSARDFRTQSPG
jgi:hypothetical protein